MSGMDPSEPVPEVAIPKPPMTPAARWAIAVTIAGAIALAGYLAVPPYYRRVKHDRGVRLAREAEERMASGQFDEAAKMLRAALKLAPGDVEVSRATARVAARVGQVAGLVHWANVNGSGRATLDDLVGGSEMAIRYGRLDLSGPWLKRAYDMAPADRRVLRLSQRQLLRLGDRPHAIEFARAVLREHPDDPEATFELGRLLAGSAGASARAEGERLLWPLAAGHSAFQVPSAEVLARLPGRARVQLEGLARSLEADAASLDARLLAHDLRVLLDPPSLAPRVADVVSRLESAAGTPSVGPLVAWLNRHGAIQEALPYLPPELCRTNAVLMAARLDALVALGRTDEIERIAADGSGAVNAQLTLAARAVVAGRQGRRTESEALFRDAVKARPRSAPVLLFVATQAEAAGMPGLALDAYQELIAFPASTLDAARQALRLSRPMDDLRVPLRTLRALNAYMPGDEGVAGERAWIEALVGEEKEFAHATLSHLARSRPDDPGWVFALGLATWRRGDAPGGLQMVEQPQREFASMEPRWQAVYVALLGANQRREAARKFAARVDMARLHAQERALVDPWR